MRSGKSPMNQLRLRFFYNEKDVVTGYRLHFKSTLNLPLTFVVSALSIILGIFYLAFDSGTSVGYLLIVFPILLIGILLFVLLLFPRILYRRDKKYNELYAIVFSDEGIVFKKDSGEAGFDWFVYTRAIEDRNTYILYFGRNDFTIIPKRVFMTAEEESIFRRLLAENSLLY
jgi:hypothetical protein